MVCHSHNSFANADHLISLWVCEYSCLMDLPPVSKRFQLYNSARRRSFKTLQFSLILFCLKSHARLTQPDFEQGKNRKGEYRIYIDSFASALVIPPPCTNSEARLTRNKERSLKCRLCPSPLLTGTKNTYTITLYSEVSYILHDKRATYEMGRRNCKKNRALACPPERKPRTIENDRSKPYEKTN